MISYFLMQSLVKSARILLQTVSDSHYFEIFTAEQILKDFDLSYDEIEGGRRRQERRWRG